MSKTKKVSKPEKKTHSSKTEDKPTAGAAEKMQKIIGKKIRIKCKNHRQKEFTKLITEKEVVIAAGPPGTGKSYLSIGKGLELVQNKTNNYERLLIMKPAVEAEENLGFLPGDLKEKLEPHLASSIDIVDKIVGESKRRSLEEEGVIVVGPLGFIRGKTIDNSIVIIEEAQNLSPNQLKTLLTRIGENSKYIISGDLNQSDRFRKFTQTGLYDVFQRHSEVEEIGFFVFNPMDIVRNPLISKILENYDEHSFFDAPLYEGEGEATDLTGDDDEDIIKYDKSEKEEEKELPFKNLDEATAHMNFFQKIGFKFKYNLYLSLQYLTIGYENRNNT
jgi:phosphate starvation-inducible protein PhoH